MAAADALGRSFIINKDAHFSSITKKKSARFNVGEYIVSASGLNWFACEDERVKVSFDLIPQEVLTYLKNKSLSIAGVENQELLDAIQSKLEQALRDGLTYREWAASARETIDALGYSGDQPFRLGTIYRTNVFSSYTMGQMEQVNQVKNRFPCWRYIAILDDRTRPAHRKLHGMIFPVGEGPIPPIDYNCRCHMQMIHIDEMMQSLIHPLEGDALDEFMNQLNEKTQVLNLDQKSAFNQWLKDKEKAMLPAMKEAMSEAQD